MKRAQISKYYQKLERYNFQPVSESAHQGELVLPGLPNKMVYDFLIENQIAFAAKFGDSFLRAGQFEPISDPSSDSQKTDKNSDVDSIDEADDAASTEKEKEPKQILDIDFHVPSGSLHFWVKYFDHSNDHNDWLTMSQLEDNYGLIALYFELIDRKSIVWFTHFDEEGEVIPPSPPSSIGEFDLANTDNETDNFSVASDLTQDSVDKLIADGIGDEGSGDDDHVSETDVTGSDVEEI